MNHRGPSHLNTVVLQVLLKQTRYQGGNGFDIVSVLKFSSSVPPSFFHFFFSFSFFSFLLINEQPKTTMMNTKKRAHETQEKNDNDALDDHEDQRARKQSRSTPAVSRECPYLDTIQRQRLDFDFEKQCSVTLSRQHVYVCLVCGQIFQGRGRQTPAYTHSVQNFHHVFMNLHNAKIYCLPDNYEVIDSSLRDIQNALDPHFTSQDIRNLDANTALSKDILGVQYLPGFIGMNNLKRTDYINVTVHALAHVLPLRDYFLQPENYKDCTSVLVQSFGALLRKIWSPGNFKATVSPHELVQTIVTESEKKFTIESQYDVMDFATWLLNQLHL